MWQLTSKQNDNIFFYVFLGPVSREFKLYLYMHSAQGMK